MVAGNRSNASPFPDDACLIGGLVHIFGYDKRHPGDRFCINLSSCELRHAYILAGVDVVQFATR